MSSGSSGSSGNRANRRGRQLERFVAEELDDAGYQLIHPPGLVFAMRYLDQPIYARQVEIGLDLYDKKRRVDFLLFHPTLHENGLVIQCKWQSSSGSVEEKYAFEVLNIQRGHYETIIILDGGGYSDGAKQWLYNQTGDNNLLHVFNQGEFLRYIARGGLK